MQAEQTHSGDLYTLLGWLDQNRKQLITGATIVVLVGIVVAFFVWQRGAREVQAGEALSALLASGGATGGVSSDSLLKLAADHGGTAAAARAQLAAAGQLFTEGKYADAQTQFQKFLANYSDSPLATQASLGAAASLEAQSKTAEAIAAYKGIAERKQDVAAAAQAKFSLARLYQADGKLAMARDLYMELASDPNSLSGSEAQGKLSELLRQHPDLRPAPAAPPTNGLMAVPQK